MGRPKPDYKEQAYFLRPSQDIAGNIEFAVINKKLRLGVCFKYKAEELPFLTIWKMMGEKNYVLGLEPGNCVPEGYRNAKDSGRLQYLQPFEEKTANIDIEFLSGAQLKSFL